MPFVRSLASKYYAYIIATILSLNKIMPSYSCYIEKKLVYIIIAAPFNCQFSSCIKCTKFNIYLSYDIRLVFNAKYASFIYLIIL